MRWSARVSDNQYPEYPPDPRTQGGASPFCGPTPTPPYPLPPCNRPGAAGRGEPLSLVADLLDVVGRLGERLEHLRALPLREPVRAEHRVDPLRARSNPALRVLSSTPYLRVPPRTTSCRAVRTCAYAVLPARPSPATPTTSARNRNADRCHIIHYIYMLCNTYLGHCCIIYSILYAIYTLHYVPLTFWACRSPRGRPFRTRAPPEDHRLAPRWYYSSLSAHWYCFTLARRWYFSTLAPHW
jgi:hypothetical protein